MTGSEKDSAPSDTEVDSGSSHSPIDGPHKVKWYRSTFFNALILGICNFLAPGIWGAMNSLGGGGAQEPYLVNAANALTFGLMVVSCFFSSVIVRFIGIKWTLIVGTMGFAPYAAGLYLNNRYGQEWLVLLGAALCGISAGIFWMAEAAIALSYPEPYNQGRFLGFWLGFRVGGQILGGVISLGINSNRSTSGAVSYTVYIVFITLQALAPFAGLLLSNPSQVQRKDGIAVKLHVTNGVVYEMKRMVKLWINRKFLLIVPFICQAVYTEAVMFSYQGLWFSVRARALGSFLSGVIALIIGNVLGAFLDNKRISLKRRTRYAFFFVVAWQGMCWVWASVVTTEFHETHPVYDWTDPNFGRGFTLFLFWVAGFQLNYMYLFFLVGNLADDHEEVVRISGLLRGTESAAQCVSYGLSSVNVMAAVGSVYLNFGMWAIAIYPAWLIVKEIGEAFGDKKVARETHGVHEAPGPA
ncbi:Major facilitator superfamily domain general substrate transporter [Penicillium paradoxum]|uniref:Major facilitator superfamily domain general substrate transporter n=1 Tax=Penicillium paradoxum TaxID=176176 RepID=UPI0025497E36|nr:Major facilitator superfamily domain general substrate transporter [Penicillium paradoxum]KAJ5780311.1 Major facilitator superfamily domain general substrate transporter [Penicillium paradoxum]